MKHVSLIFIWLLWNMCSVMQAVVVGSNTVVSRQGSALFPAADVDNEMRGFASFENGFILEDSSTAVIFNSLYPVLGTIQLNGGLVYLSTNLRLGETALISSFGTIQGNSNALKFDMLRDVTLPASSLKVLGMISKYNVGSPINSVDWSSDSSYLVSGASSGDVRIYAFNGSNVSSVASTMMTNTVNTVRWHPSSDYIALGTMLTNYGNELEVWKYIRNTNTFTRTDYRDIAKDVYAVAWHPQGNYLAIGRNNLLSELALYSFSNGTLTDLASIDISPNRVVGSNCMSWDPSGNYLAVGVSYASTNPQLLLYYLHSSTLTLTLSANVGLGVTSLDWSPTGSFVAVGLANGADTLRVYQHNSANGTLVENTSARVGESLSVLSTSWAPDGNSLVIGRAAGTSTEFRTYKFDKASKTLTLAAELDMSANVNAVRWAKNGTYIARGGNLNRLAICRYLPDTFIFNGTQLAFESNVFVQKGMTFQGNCVLNGNGKILDLGTAGALIADSGSNLLIRDIILRNVAGTNIQCVDSTANITLENVHWIQTNSFIFNAGSLDINGEVLMSGSYAFVYKSDQVSTIQSESTLILDSGMTFSYDPGSTSQSLLLMSDKTSKMHLFEATLYATGTGMVLSRGTVEIEGECTLATEGTAPVRGIIIGDGTSALNDLDIKFFAESTLKVAKGYVVYNNVEA